MGARGAPRLPPPAPRLPRPAPPPLPPPLLRPFRCLLMAARLVRVRIRSSRCWRTASAISPPVSESLLTLLPPYSTPVCVCLLLGWLLACLGWLLACHLACVSRPATSCSPASYLSASLLYFLYLPLYSTAYCHSLLTLLPPYATYCICIWLLMYLLYSTYFICLLTLLTLYASWYAVYGV